MGTRSWRRFWAARDTAGEESRRREVFWGVVRTRRISVDSRNEPQILSARWYDATKWLLERVDSFPKNRQFIFS